MASRRAQQLLAATKMPSRLYHFERIEHCPLILSLRTPTTTRSIRQFSTSPPRRARAGHRSSGREVKPMKGGGAQAQPSLALLQKKAQRDAMASGRMFDEVGVLPDTFVLQPAAERPSWTQAFADRWLWEKARAKDRVIKAYQFIAIKFFMVRLTPPEAHAALPLWSRIKSYFPPRSGWYNFQLLQSAMIADALYKDMYTALAAGNLDRVEGKLKRDVLASLRSRVLSRGSHTDTRWKLEKYNAKPRTVAYTVALVDPNKPKWRQTWMQQAVVEMDTEQSLVRTKRVIRPGGREEVVEGKKESGGTVREYVVIQKLVVDGVEEGWKIWGMTRATTLADVKKAERKRLGLEEEEGEEV